MHLDLAAVDVWKEILSQERSKPERKKIASLDCTVRLSIGTNTRPI
jgi:hypothetical protein